MRRLGRVLSKLLADLAVDLVMECWPEDSMANNEFLRLLYSQSQEPVAKTGYPIIIDHGIRLPKPVTRIEMGSSAINVGPFSELSYTQL